MDFRKYLVQLYKINFSEVTCSYCAHTAVSPDGKEAMCNFCENYVNVGEFEFKEGTNKITLLEVQDLIRGNSWEDAEKLILKMLEDAPDPRLLYVSAAFYRYFSDYRYYNKDYNLKGFMSENANNIRQSLELTSKWKECLYKALKMINIELSNSANRLLRLDLLYIKFMSYIKLHRKVEAARALNELVGLKRLDLLNAYAGMVYAVEFNMKNAVPSMVGLLGRGEINSFYYAAKYLAKNKNPKEAKFMLEKTIGKANMPFAVPLMKSIEAEEAHYK